LLYRRVRNQESSIETIVKRLIKRTVTILALGAFTAALVFAFLPKPVAVDLGQVSTGPLQVFVEEDGKTRLRDRYTVSAPLAGRLQRISLDPGDIIPAGRTVAIIEPLDPALLDPRALAQAEARVKSAEAALDRAAPMLEAAQAALDLAETEYARSAELHEKKALAKTELDLKTMLRRTRTAEYRAARHSEEVARFELELARAALLRTRPGSAEGGESLHFEIPAPPLAGSGRVFHVLRVFQESAGVVAPGTALLELGDPADLEVEIDVLSSDAVKIRPGARVLLEQWGGDEPLIGRVRLVEPSGFTKISALGVEEQRVNVIVDFPDRDKIPQTLGDGYRVEAKIIIWEQDEVLRVPTSALFRHGEGWAVFRVEQGKATRHPVHIGRRSGLFAQVLEGLSLDDTVIVHPSDKVVDGVMVEPR
jgi:HlyD family secretion protein